MRRDDIDGDNWPSTWCSDGSHLMAYGDGWGVRPMKTTRKLNSGLVEVFGRPERLQAVEVPLPYFGVGAENPNLKGCGLLEANGVVYQFLRYQSPEIEGRRTQIGSKLIWSTDGGATWVHAQYGKDEEALGLFFREPDHAFHSPSFLQAGRHYRDAPDEYAYLYSPREDRRRANDRMDLARVPLRSITDRGAYEFFAGFGDDGEPLWTSDSGSRAPVLTLPGHVSPGDVVYVRALERYLMATVGGSFDGPSRLVLLDSPRPWGPWTLVGAIEPWGTGRQGDHRYDPRIPAGWVREDGMSFHLVYSDRIVSDKLNLQEVRLVSASPVPAFEWGVSSPEEAGFDPARLRSLEETLAAAGNRALLIARGDNIVSEVYGQELDAPDVLGKASLAKSLVGGMSLLLLLQDRRVDLDDPVCHWIPEWCTDRWKSRITIRHLATHASGLENAWIDGVPASELPGWKGEFWRRDRSRWRIWRSEPNPFEIARDRAPVLFEPGHHYAYSNTGLAALAIVAAAALKNAPENDVEKFLRDRLMRPIGISDNDWGISYGRSWTMDGLPLHANWGGAAFTARATARIGRLLLQEGRWQGRTIIDPRWVRLAVSDQHAPRPVVESDSFIPVTGLLWWLNTNRVWPSLPPDAMVGAGDGHRILLVVPSLDLIVVCNRKEPDVRIPSGEEQNEYWASLEDVLFRPLIAAVARSDPESPPRRPPDRGGPLH